MPIATQRATVSQFHPNDRQRLRMNRGDRVDIRPTPDGNGAELFVNGRQRHEVTAMEVEQATGYYRIAYEQARADDALLAELGATEDRVAAADVHLSNLAATPTRPAISARALAETWLQEAAPGATPEIRIDPNLSARFTIPRGLQGAARANFERWQMPYSSGISSVVGEIESEIADLRRHGYTPKVIAVDGNVMSHLRGSAAFQWQHRVEAMPVMSEAEVDDMFSESRVQVEGTLFGIRLIQDDQTEGYVIAVKR